jgi:hypothetical protein
MNPFCLVISAVGCWLVAAGLRDWPWFWNNSRARVVVFLIGRRGARVFYVTMGAGFIVLGIWCAFEAVP